MLHRSSAAAFVIWLLGLIPVSGQCEAETFDGRKFEQIFAPAHHSVPTFTRPEVNALFPLEPLEGEDITTQATAPARVENPWWVVVGSILDGPDKDRTTDTIRARTTRCRLATSQDLSSKFSGFRPGYVVVVVGPLDSQPEAARTLEMVRPCVPDAYTKQGRHFRD